jgi:hypothetical protein
MPAEKRYQVFVSSTFSDLQDERQEVIQALLELDCMPAGMELFPAANEDQWTLIKRVIDDCDYYLVVVAGRYGSLGPDGTSYTEMEYKYAVERGKPVMAFLHEAPGKIPSERSETSTERRAKLEAFRALLEKKHCRYWDSAPDLGSKVSRSLVKMIRDNPAVGWVKADQIPDEASAEILSLRHRVDELVSELEQARTRAPEGTESLAKGDDPCGISFRFQAGPADEEDYDHPQYGIEMETTWNKIFAGVAPLMMDEASDGRLKKGVETFLAYEFTDDLQKTRQIKGSRIHDFEIDEADYQTIKVQLRALGLITKSPKRRSLRDTAAYWTLTPYGDATMTRLRAIRREDAENAKERSPTSRTRRPVSRSGDS